MKFMDLATNEDKTLTLKQLRTGLNLLYLLENGTPDAKAGASCAD